VSNPDGLTLAEHYSPFGDAVEELTELDALLAEEEGADDPDDEDFDPDRENLDPDHKDGAADDQQPAVNPFRDVGRNDPCPCGSGKKFKKCCLARVQAGETIDRAM
jgi:hypothetical protein